MSYEKDYVKKHLGEPLTLALTDICLKRPKDPILYLAQWLLHWQRIKGQLGGVEKSSRKDELKSEFELAKDSETTEDLGYHVLGASERERIEELIGQMVVEEIAILILEAKCDHGNVEEETERSYSLLGANSWQEMLKELMLQRILSAKVRKTVTDARMDSGEYGDQRKQEGSVLAKTSLEELLKEEILQRMIASGIGNGVLEAQADTKRAEEKRREDYRLLVRKSLDELLREENIQMWIAEKVEKKLSKLKVVSSTEKDVDKKDDGVLGKNSIEKILFDVIGQVLGPIFKEKSSFEELLEEQILQRVLATRDEIVSSEREVDFQNSEQEVGKASSGQEVGKNRSNRNSLEAMLKEQLMQSFLNEKNTTRVGIESRNSLEELIRKKILQEILMKGVKIGKRDEADTDSDKKELKKGSKVTGVNSLEEIMKEEIFQRLEVAGVEKARPETDSNTSRKGLGDQQFVMETGESKRGSKTMGVSSLEEIIKEEIQKRMEAAGVEKSRLQSDSSSGTKEVDGERFVMETGESRRDSKTMGVNSLEEIIKEEIQKRMEAAGVEKAGLETDSNGGARVSDEGFVIETDKSKKDSKIMGIKSLEKIIKDEIFQRMEASGVENYQSRLESDSNGSTKGLDQRFVMETGVSKKDSKTMGTNSLEEIIKEVILQRMQAAGVGNDKSRVETDTNSGIIGVGDQRIVKKTGESKRDSKTTGVNSLEKIIKEVILQRMETSEFEKSRLESDSRSGRKGVGDQGFVMETGSSKQLLEGYPRMQEEEDEDVMPI